MNAEVKNFCHHCPQYQSTAPKNPPLSTTQSSAYYWNPLWESGHGSVGSLIKVFPGPWIYLDHCGLCHPLPWGSPPSKGILQENRQRIGPALLTCRPPKGPSHGPGHALYVQTDGRCLLVVADNVGLHSGGTRWPSHLWPATTTWTDHLHHFKAVLGDLKEAGLTTNSDRKCRNATWGWLKHNSWDTASPGVAETPAEENWGNSGVPLAHEQKTCMCILGAGWLLLPIHA